jgi:hypothetical protein
MDAVQAMTGHGGTPGARVRPGQRRLRRRPEVPALDGAGVPAAQPGSHRRPAVEAAARRRILRAAPGELSAAEVADDIGVSRVTARRYLERLASQRLASRSPRYGGAAGRPEYRYRWRT